ncbi:MAG: bifunctional 2-C-methyl-D-erythritol 4-phosphate cytidylyltransferase/2-C-methyl-D-erythritol 2,4-cyclodiphosphate synthase [Geminicoccaceae bacterium]|nr:bifunctional 2-C-methyl-D-erythritol 4-phosphate cytidylyltransferase/2-C-methyl-D-erythritol 2,4-cyclodiphosphate synthase [Geminicoccaceae bacterium]
MSINTLAVIVAGGSGARFGSDRPKQYAHLQGRPILRHTVERFLAAPGIDAVQVVIAEGHRPLYAEATAGLDLPPPVIGGTDRQASTRAGLEAVATRAPARVLVQDAARPLTSAALIARVCEALSRHPAVVPVLPVADTLKQVEGAVVLADLPRDAVRRTQTPQGFRFADLLAAHRAHAGSAHTDDAAVAMAAGIEVHTVVGDEDNLKITREEDLRRAERWLAGANGGAGGWSWRTATGFDVHAFAADRPLMLGGVQIPFERGLGGHSDADVGLHALTDALLGCIAAGDIGTHFPPSEPRWRDASSDRFLAFAADRVREAGGRIEHVDLTLICEAPKIGPHRDAMRRTIARILGVAVDAVSVKATTTERLGFTGRGEGIAAQAAATVALPRP